MYAVNDLNDSKEITETVGKLPIEVQSVVASALRDAYVLGFDNALQLSASVANKKDQFDIANEILKIGQNKV